jgi:hypothetical protein
MAPEKLPQVHEDLSVGLIPHLDAERFDRLALIITRLDAARAVDHSGNYEILLQSPLQDGESPSQPDPAPELRPN